MSARTKDICTLNMIGLTGEVGVPSLTGIWLGWGDELLETIQFHIQVAVLQSSLLMNLAVFAAFLTTLLTCNFQLNFQQVWKVGRMRCAYKGRKVSWPCRL